MPCSGMREGKENIQWFLEVPISGRWEEGGERWCVPPVNLSPYFVR